MQCLQSNYQRGKWGIVAAILKCNDYLWRAAAAAALQNGIVGWGCVHHLQKCRGHARYPFAVLSYHARNAANYKVVRGLPFIF